MRSRSASCCAHRRRRCCRRTRACVRRPGGAAAHRLPLYSLRSVLPGRVPPAAIRHYCGTLARATVAMLSGWALRSLSGASRTTAYRCAWHALAAARGGVAHSMRAGGAATSAACADRTRRRTGCACCCTTHRRAPSCWRAKRVSIVRMSSSCAGRHCRFMQPDTWHAACNGHVACHMQLVPFRRNGVYGTTFYGIAAHLRTRPGV